MPERKEPGPDHPITLSPNPKRVVVTHRGKVVADSRRALTMREASYAPVAYIPKEDVNMALLSATDHGSYCPYKGQASYWSVSVDGDTSDNAVWAYEEPYPAVADIAGKVAFWKGRVDSIEERDA